MLNLFKPMCDKMNIKCHCKEVDIIMCSICNKVAIIMGSESDYDVMKKTEELLKYFEVEFETKVLSAHRNPIETLEFSKTAEEKGFDVIIAGAGKAAHLPGVLASMTTLPVIGVPIKSGALGGVDALLSIVQMPRGVPVATVGINESENAAILAIQILAINNKKLKDKLNKYKIKLK